MLGIREPNIYGKQDYPTLVAFIQEAAAKLGLTVDVRQSNHEGDIIDWLQQAYFEGFDGVVINPGAYTHTSLAIAHAIKSIAPLPVVEVHISDINNREDIRKKSLCAPHCIAQISGKGFEGYVLAIKTIQKS